ncbi:GNAT family N-acetyltransferase [Altererythrobacter aerius]|uniref:GNAT family N-acetyltransferase n=1 Tax=Tsuneonella aeria TaxID=1837929 RepID=A0A6I4TH40_9SPHN|nr:GNAT family N-acetyltransferase [Tsuneonella aeria]MXO75330.1 GNAT family N-acetyltransferase [Tsuneonella aeria]
MTQGTAQVRLDPLQVSDVEAVLAIQHDVYPAALVEDRPVFLSRIALPRSYCLAAREGARLIGYLVAHGWFANAPPPLGAVLTAEAPGDVLYIHDLGVSREGRGSGIGRTLALRAMELAAGDGIKEAQLIAVGGAEPFWRRLGFAEGAAAARIRPKLQGYGPGSRWMTRRIG